MTTRADKRMTYEGACHCGAVRSRVTTANRDVLDCNCSICRKKGFLHLIVPPEEFTLLLGANVLTTYTFNTGVAQHTFCQICGIHPFYRPRSHPGAFNVNLRCLNAALDKFQILPFEGTNWEQNAHLIQTE